MMSVKEEVEHYMLMMMSMMPHQLMKNKPLWPPRWPAFKEVPEEFPSKFTFQVDHLDMHHKTTTDFLASPC